MTTATVPSRPAPPRAESAPPEEEAALAAPWKRPKGWKIISEVNNSVVGLFYVGAAFAFFVLGGALALVMRAQLAAPENDLVSQELFNQLFSVHGTTMMFLFAVPVMEAIAVLLLPQLLGARDLPFPRLSSFAVWSYIIGGTVFFSTIFYDLAPRGGWFMYPPLTLSEYSPGNNEDFWLLGIGFIEISAIAGAIEIIVGVMRTRPPGMSLDKMPIFVWAILIFAGMIVFAFPAVILATAMLEIERAFGWPFFTAELGGDSLLWQHLFWFFGHPEVYIIFLPAAGLVSMIVPTMAQRPLVGYRLIIVALIATAFFSFGLWVHHMFTTGIPAMSLAFFSAASMAVAIPSGIQVFSWIATIAGSKGRFRFTTPAYFVLGFLFIFVLGGLTGVMVAMVPFDWQVHDTYFIVAHFHYVLVGGMVFPLFAIFYYWAPVVSRKPLSERLGRWTFWLMFIGFNVAFFPMHLSGLLGMPRRVWTYESGLGWEGYNLISTVGAFVFAAGVAVFILDLIRNLRIGPGGPDNPWNAGTLEFLPAGLYGARSIPRITSREPLWDQPGLAREVAEGRWLLPRPVTGGRETLITSPILAEPQYVARVPGPGWSQFVAAVFMSGFFLLLVFKLVTPALVCGVVSIAAMVVWGWGLDRGPEKGLVDIGDGRRLPDYMTGPASHGWWAVAALIFVLAALYLSYVFSYFYLWTVAPSFWPPDGAPALPDLQWPVASAALYILSAGLFRIARRTLAPAGRRSSISAAFILLGAASMATAGAVEIVGHLLTGLAPTQSGYGAMVFMASALAAPLLAAVVLLAIFSAARCIAGRLDSTRCATLENASLIVYYAAAQGLVGLVLVHGFPKAIL